MRVMRKVFATFTFVVCALGRFTRLTDCGLVTIYLILFIESDLAITPLQKVQQVLLWLPVTIPVPYELPGSGLSENMKIKKIYRGTLTSEFSKNNFLLRFK